MRIISLRPLMNTVLYVMNVTTEEKSNLGAGIAGRTRDEQLVASLELEVRDHSCSYEDIEMKP